MVNTVQQQPPPPKISILPNLWVILPIVAVVVAILSANLLLLNYIHVFTAILWTGTDIFMAFLLGPVLRNVSLATRKEVIFWILRLKNVAVVGMSNTNGKPANFVPKYLIENGYNVIPVNPTTNEVLGKKSYASVYEIPEQVDIIDVFRRSEDVPPVVDNAIKKKGIKVIWMQSGIYNKDAERKAKENGIDVVYNRCMKVKHSMLID